MTEHPGVDVLIIGAGVAGLVSALQVLELGPDLRVAIVDKSRLNNGAMAGGSTPLAQGGLAAAVGPDDSPALHAADTLRVSDGLGDVRAIAVMAAEGPDRVADLIRWGAVFDRNSDGGLGLAREAGQSVGRSVRAADATGAEIARALRKAAAGRVQRLQGVVVELATSEPDHRVVGAYLLLDELPESRLGPQQQSGLAFIPAGATMLATGGCGGLYASTTNPDSATADGVALAHAVGARLTDMEFIQFHPTGLKPTSRQAGDNYQRFLLTEALRGAGAVLINGSGERFMPDYHPDAELAPRYVVTKAILEQDRVELDATMLPGEQLRAEFPTVLAGAKKAGYDLQTQPVPVEPSQHYMVGGVATDLDGRTNVPGLWAAGEVASSGVHGANRMAGNSLLQASVFAHRAATNMVRYQAASAPNHHRSTVSPSLAWTHRDTTSLRHTLRTAMSIGAGPVRNHDGLMRARKDVSSLRADIGQGPFDSREMTELYSAIVTATIIIESALLRVESRGVHWRDDALDHDPLFDGRHLSIQRPGA